MVPSAFWFARIVRAGCSVAFVRVLRVGTDYFSRLFCISSRHWNFRDILLPRVSLCCRCGYCTNATKDGGKWDSY